MTSKKKWGNIKIEKQSKTKLDSQTLFSFLNDPGIMYMQDRLKVSQQETRNVN